MRTADSLDEFDIKNNSILGFEIEFKKQKTSLEELKNILNSVVSGDIITQRVGKYISKKETFILREKWSRSGLHYEIVTPPLNYEKAIQNLNDILNWMQKEDVKTDYSTGLHINVSFSNMDLKYNFNPIKLAVLFNENSVYNIFDNREKSFYARSLFDFLKVNPNIVFSQHSNIVDQFDIPNNKSFGFNLDKINLNYLEARHIGGMNYHEKDKDILKIVDELILATSNANTRRITKEEQKELLERLSNAIEKAKALRTYDNFKKYYPEVSILVNLDEHDEAIKAYFHKLAPLFKNIIPDTGKTEMTINYDSDLGVLQIKEAYLMDVLNAHNIEFFDCTLRGVFDNCKFYNSNVRNSRISNSRLEKTDVKYNQLNKCTLTRDCAIFRSFLINSTSFADVDGSNVLLDSKVKEPGTKAARTKQINT